MQLFGAKQTAYLSYIMTENDYSHGYLQKLWGQRGAIVFQVKQTEAACDHIWHRHRDKNTVITECLRKEVGPHGMWRSVDGLYFHRKYRPSTDLHISGDLLLWMRLCHSQSIFLINNVNASLFDFAQNDKGSYKESFDTNVCCIRWSSPELVPSCVSLITNAWHHFLTLWFLQKIFIHLEIEKFLYSSGDQFCFCVKLFSGTKVWIVQI